MSRNVGRFAESLINLKHISSIKAPEFARLRRSLLKSGSNIAKFPIIGDSLFSKSFNELNFPNSAVRGGARNVSQLSTNLLIKSADNIVKSDEFKKLSEEIESDIDKIIEDFDLDRSSVEIGHKIIALRSTALSRLHGEISNLYDDPIQKAKKEDKIDDLKETVKRNKAYIRFTGHPTEGQNLSAIKTKDAGIVKIQVIKARVAKNGNLVSAQDIVELARIAKDFGIENLFIKNAIEKSLPTAEEFFANCDFVRKGTIQNFFTNPIHHVKKMTPDEEVDLILYHLDRSKKEVAAIATKHGDIINVEDIEFSSWACDMDGKPHIKAGHAVIFEYKSKEKFFKSLEEKLEDFSQVLAIEGIDNSFFESEILNKIKEIKTEYIKRILAGDKADEIEKKISDILSKYKIENNRAQFQEIENYVKSSGCKAAKNGFTTREEVDKIKAIFAEITEKCQDKEGFAENKIKVIAENFAEFSDEAKRQIMILMESASLHPNHEHIISQFDCELESYKEILEFFKIAQRLPEYHQLIPYFKEYYSEKSKEAGFDIYEELFNEEAILRSKKSVVQLSPLAETEETIPKLVEFTRQLLADLEIADYIEKSGGIVRQTRSNSDGSSSLGAHKVVVEYLKADREIRKIVEERGFNLKILQGIGANDIERMAPWNLELLQSEFTAQGGDAQHQTRNRMEHMLLKDEDSSLEFFTKLEKEYGEEEVEALTNFYYKLHLDGEFGLKSEIEGRPIYSAKLPHRGLIPAATVKKLGNLSSRPDARSGDSKETELEVNGIEVLDKMIFNLDMRRIGEISTQRASCVATFLLSPFYRNPESLDKELIFNYSEIPLIRNNNISAIFALGTADFESFLLTNGFDDNLPDNSILRTAADYEHLLDLYYSNKMEEVAEFSKEKHFDDISHLRSGAMCYHISNSRKVLRNALSPLIHKSSLAVKEAMEEIFIEAESSNGLINKNYGNLVIKACEILVNDQALNLQTKQSFACAAQQIANVRQAGHFYDTRKLLISNAHDALEAKDVEKFDESCDFLARIMRSAGNPLSPGRKTHELIEYFHDRYGEKAAIPLGHLVEKTELKDSSFQTRSSGMSR